MTTSTDVVDNNLSMWVASDRELEGGQLDQRTSSSTTESAPVSEVRITAAYYLLQFIRMERQYECSSLSIKNIHI